MFWGDQSWLVWMLGDFHAAAGILQHVYILEAAVFSVLQGYTWRDALTQGFCTDENKPCRFQIFCHTFFNCVCSKCKTSADEEQGRVRRTTVGCEQWSWE